MKRIPLGLSYNDVLLIPQFSAIRSRSHVDLSTRIAPEIKLTIPLLSVNMDTVTGIEMAIAMYKLGGLGLIGRFDPVHTQADKIAKIKKAGADAIGTIGVKGDYIKRAEALLRAGSLALHLDIAHAHSAHALEVVSACKNRFPAVAMYAGTIATYQGAVDLYSAGADTVKVGIGGGAICITRISTGAGVPQVTSIMEAVRAKKRFKNKFVIADGGAANSGDIVKALAAGADAYQGGSLFAGTDEAPGILIEKNGVFYKEYNGSTCKAEKLRQLAKDGEGKTPHYTIHVEGVEAMVKYKGPVKDVVEGLCAGIRSGLSYAGARNIKELWEKAEFIQITQAGYHESQAHDVVLR